MQGCQNVYTGNPDNVVTWRTFMQVFLTCVGEGHGNVQCNWMLSGCRSLSCCSKSCTDATGDSWQSSLTQSHTPLAILYSKKEWNSTIYRVTSTHSIVQGGDEVFSGMPEGINDMVCGCKRSTHKLLHMLQHKEMCWMPSFGGHLLQHNEETSGMLQCLCSHQWALRARAARQVRNEEVEARRKRVKRLEGEELKKMKEASKMKDTDEGLLCTYN